MITTRKQNNKLVTNPATRTHLPRTLAQTIFFFFTFFVFFGSSKLTRNGSHFLFLHFPLPRLKILYNYETFTSKISSSSYIRRTLAKFCFSFLDLKKKSQIIIQRTLLPRRFSSPTSITWSVPKIPDAIRFRLDLILFFFS